MYATTGMTTCNCI